MLKAFYRKVFFRHTPPESDRVMLKSIQVSNFRSLHEAKVQKLKRLNLVTGSNGGGKTSLLEAVFLNAGAANAALVFSINGFRGDNVITPESDRVFRSWFWQLDPKNRIQITSDAVAHARTRSRTLLIDPLLRSQVTPGRSESEISHNAYARHMSTVRSVLEGAPC